MVKSSFKNTEEKKNASFETIYFTWFVDGVLFSNLVCSAIWEGFIFMVTVNATIFLITFSQQRKVRFSWAEVKSSGRGGKRPQEAFGTEPLHLPPLHPPLLPSANAGPQRGALIHPQGPPHFVSATESWGSWTRRSWPGKWLSQAFLVLCGIPCMEKQQWIYVLHAAGRIILSWEECPVVCVGAESHLRVP